MRHNRKGVTAVTGKAIQVGLDFIIADASGPRIHGWPADLEARSSGWMFHRFDEGSAGFGRFMPRMPMTVRERSSYERDLSKMCCAP